MELILLDNWMFIEIVWSDILHVKSGKSFYNFYCIFLTSIIQINPLNGWGKISFVDESLKETNMFTTESINQLENHR
jgi:hypothetical protein